MHMKILLHMCCAPCSVYPVSILKEKNIDFEGFFYNPNIHPIEEFNKREENVEIFSKIQNLKVHYFNEFSQKKWENFKGEEQERCYMCYSTRLEKAAQYASENGFEAFTTTLLVSPYQKHDLIRELGEKFAQQYGISFYYEDFRSGFREGQQQAKNMGLYRQKYCGCIVSFKKRQNNIKNKR
jgi:predicted adenine nucleotide alpha hydrolase (AANH) superfamily ATPase